MGEVTRLGGATPTGVRARETVDVSKLVHVKPTSVRRSGAAKPDLKTPVKSGQPAPAVSTAAKPPTKTPTGEASLTVTNSGSGLNRTTSTKTTVKNEWQVGPGTKINVSVSGDTTNGATDGQPTRTSGTAVSLKGTRALTATTDAFLEFGRDETRGIKGGKSVNDSTNTVSAGVSTKVKFSPNTEASGEIKIGHKSGITDGAPVSENTLGIKGGVTTKVPLNSTTSLTAGAKGELGLKNSPATNPVSTVNWSAEVSVGAEHDTPLNVGGSGNLRATAKLGTALTGAGFIGGNTPAAFSLNPTASFVVKTDWKTGQADCQKATASLEAGLDGKFALDGKTQGSLVPKLEAKGSLGIAPGATVDLTGTVKGNDWINNSSGSSELKVGLGWKF
jgi:hypothetical protein